MLIDKKIVAFSKTHTMLPDVPSPAMSATEIKAWWDSSAEEARVAINGIIDDLTNLLGASYIGSDAITGVTGVTVQEKLVSLKGLIDTLSTSTTNSLDIKANLADVYSKLDLLSTTAGDSGADKVKASAISGVPGETVQELLQELKYQINSAVTGTIPDGSITPAKLTFTPATLGVDGKVPAEQLNVQPTSDASTTVKGIVQLTNSVTNTSETLAATALSVKTAMDRADTAFTQANDVKTNVANAIGSPATSSDTGATLANIITTQKGRLATEIGDGDSTSTLTYLADRLIVRSDAIATATNGRGVATTSTDTLAQLVTKIGQIGGTALVSDIATGKTATINSGKVTGTGKITTLTPSINWKYQQVGSPSFSGATPTKVLTATIPYAGVVRVSFKISPDSAPDMANARIYKNGVATGTLRSTNASSGMTWTENFTVIAGDKLELYVWMGANTGKYSLFNVGYDGVETVTVTQP